MGMHDEVMEKSRRETLWSVMHELGGCEQRIGEVERKLEAIALEQEGYQAHLGPLRDERTALEARAIAALDQCEAYTVARCGDRSVMLLDGHLVAVRVVSAADIQVPETAPLFPTQAAIEGADAVEIALRGAFALPGDDGAETQPDGAALAPSLGQIDAEVN